MNWVRILLSFILGLSVFSALESFFHLKLWVSFGIAVAATFLAGIEKLLEISEKALDIRKKWLEVRKLQREEEEKNLIVKLATPDEIQEHGVSYVERELRARERTKTPDELKPKPFISDSHEDKF